MTDYYVRNDGNDNNTGQGEGTDEAWQNISKITTGSFSPGDNIYFNKGDTWVEQLIVPDSGSSGNIITFGAYGEGNKPVIDAELTRYYCIHVSGKDYITIDGLELKDCTRLDWQGACVRIDGGSTNVIVKNCDIYHPQSRGLDIDGSSDCTIEDNLIDTTPIDNLIEADGIYLQNGSGGHIIQSNTIYLKVDGSYVDGIQSVNEDGFTIRYNWIENPTGYASNEGTMLIQLEGGSGTFNVYYNVLFNDTNQFPLLIIEGTATYNIYNNVIINIAGGGDWESVCVKILGGSTDSGWTFRNNIFYTSNSLCFISMVGVDSTAQLNYNLYYRSGGGDIAYDNIDERTWGEWQGLGYEANGYNVDPEFIDFDNQDFTLALDSPCINKGEDVGLIRDYAGNVVPTGDSPDIGAYEYGGEGLPLVCYNSFKAKIMDGTIDLENHTIKCALVGSGYTPDIDADNEWADISGNEISGTGYTVGGKALEGKDVSADTTDDEGVFDADDTTWSGSTITAQYAVLYDDTETNDDLIGYIDFLEDKVSISGDFTIKWNSEGIINLG